ncbi:hypothetical protein OPT61_g6993 [Boeremia exigua]|uniref:Uncharacterized protein n=1 Tax=Boeremia exigua TaxID=749465 RepID=A0ACC2I417_9PLEO|nr:hypothetical protein OPT61_g6993 [Boeremia exigua]
MEPTYDGLVGKRALLTSASEKKIDRLEDRLASIENLLLNLGSKLDGINVDTPFNEQVNQSAPQSSRPTGSSSTETEETTPTAFEGETSISTQSGYVRELLVQVVGETPSVGQNAEVRAALTALEELVTPHKQDPAAVSAAQPLVDRSYASIDTTKLPLPPWSVVKLAIDKAMKHPTMIFAALFSILKLRNLDEIMEDAYFNPATCGAPRRLLAYGVMYNIFTEFASVPWSGIDKTTLAKYASMSRVVLEVAISQLDMLIPASYENIMALSMGTACAIEMSRPSLAWVFISNAAALCRDLGYHRFATLHNDTEEDQRSKIHLFWMIYMFDKQLSLRLGRASVIQDWDVSLPVLAPRKVSFKGFEESDMLTYWVKTAKVQGQIYESLFSAAAFLKTPAEREQIASNLVNAMEQAWHERGNTSPMEYTNLLTPNETEVPSRRKRSPQANDDALNPDTYIDDAFGRVEDAFFHTDVVVHYSTCALIQRAISADNNRFNQECLEFSRAALVAHMRCSAQFNSKGNTELWSGYIHWSILQAPLTP